MSPNIVTPETKSNSVKLSTFYNKVASNTTTETASKFYINKLRAVTPTRTENKPPNIETKSIIQPEVKPPSSKPPKKPPPDSKYNNHAGSQRVRVGAADIKPGQHRNKVKWKNMAPAQRVPGRDNNKQ